ncbi:hypothetical protein V3W47_18895 [Deinococcus sp. YIM 134068]|uniref:hypothetical protein n=1 Tax=Deinococcus lichenicola TaxID=3118910 RepID=UPI002F9576A1
MMPRAMTPGELVQPAPVPVAALVGKVQPRASSSGHHVAGLVSTARVIYADLHAFAWYSPQAGRELRGPRVMFGRAGLKGSEDNGKRKQ